MNYYSRNPNVKREVLRLAQERALQQTKNIPLNEVLVNRFYGGVYSGRGKQPEPEIIEEEIFGAGEKNTDLGDIKKVLEEIKKELAYRPTQAPRQAPTQAQRQATTPPAKAEKPKIDLSGITKKMMEEAQILMDWMKAQLFTTTDINTQIFYLDQWITQLKQQENSGRIIITGYNYNQPAINITNMDQANKIISFLVKILDAWKLQLNQNFESAWSTIYNFRIINKSTYPKWLRDRYQQMLKDYEQQQKPSGSTGILGALGFGQGEKDKEDEKLGMEVKGLKDKEKKIPKLTEKDKDKVAKDINKIEEKTAKLLNKKKELTEKDVEKVLRGTELGKQMKNDKLKGEGFGDFLEGVKEGFSKVAKPVVKAIRTVKGIAAPFVRPLMSADPRLAAIMATSDALYGTEDNYGDDDVFFSLDGMGKGKNEKLEGKGLTEEEQEFVNQVIELYRETLTPMDLFQYIDEFEKIKENGFNNLNISNELRYTFPDVRTRNEAIDKIITGLSRGLEGRGKNEKIIKTLIGKDMYENKKLPVRGGRTFLGANWEKLIDESLKKKIPLSSKEGGGRNFLQRDWKKVVETMLKNKSKMRKNNSKEGKGKKKGSSSRMKKRGEMIKKIMKEKNMSLGEASKYIKQNNLL